MPRRASRNHEYRLPSFPSDMPLISPLDIPELVHITRMLNPFHQSSADPSSTCFLQLLAVFEACDEPALASAALVSREWSRPALQVLWGDRPIWISRLVTILPEEVVQEIPFGFKRAAADGLRNQRFVMNLPTREQMERLQLYAGLIKHLR
jgi:hypothetical protein